MFKIFKRNKKGVSPLIATVLLIGFTIALAVLIWTFWGNIIKQQAEKTGAQTLGEFDCASKVSFRVKDVCYETNKLVFDLENTGSTTIDSFSMSITGSSDTVLEKLNIVIKEGEAKQTRLSYDANVGTLEEIIVFPVIIREGAPTTCTEKTVILDIINACLPA